MRKLLTLATTALAAMVLAGLFASTASAGWAIHDSDPYQSGTPCPAVSMQSNVVTGGCVIEDFEGTFQLYAMLGGVPFILGNYDSTFDLVLDANGNGYAVNQTVSVIGGGYPRVPCDETNGTIRPWQVLSGYVPNPDSFSFAAQVGLRPSNTQPGACGVGQWIGVTANAGYSNTTLDQSYNSENIRYGDWESSDLIWIGETP